ncbi:putative 2OG-Fe(II) oxygenase [Stakelama sediminis]|uniref:Tfp pilus assembly protein PilF n=1 Tax=Stakelama sediminis TaxID=463200 RepID=A0A840YVP7_9SPHN|nr:putative 2OG-Fe(II) oxygenase [Stakelama sediminis]MBB5717619.1 Tfp pilus assembly protein PilF [Stakelama sediminis]
MASHRPGFSASVMAPGDFAALASRALREQTEEQAIPVLKEGIRRFPNIAALHQWLALLHRALDQRESALRAFVEARKLSPTDGKIAHGHARTLLEAGLPAVDAFEEARRLTPQDGSVVLGLAAASFAEGDVERAIALVADAVRFNPGWLDGHAQLARLRWMAGQQDDHMQSFEQAVADGNDSADLWHLWLLTLQQAEAYEDAAVISGRARKRIGDVQFLDATDAVIASETGHKERADQLFDMLSSLEDPAFDVRKVRHYLRTAQIERALPVIDKALGGTGAAIMWPYASIAWRLSDDARADWLDRPEALVQYYDLREFLPPLEVFTDHLRGLHQARAQHLDQSVRGGTQTDGALFARIEPQIRTLREAIVKAVQRYIDALPSQEDGHPLLDVRRDRPVRFAGSWSVRLAGKGHHANHVHPAGWISSALYVSLPEEVLASQADGDTKDGALVLGEPQKELGIALPAYRTIQPKPGHLALFPSTMWHGTRPFDTGERLTVAFDVAHPAA